MLEREDLGAGAFRISGLRGGSTWMPLGPGVVLIVRTGHAEANQFEPIREALGDLIEHHPGTHVFVDGWDLTSFDPEFWSQWANWFVGHKDRIAKLYILQRSADVQMGVKMLNLFTGDLCASFTERVEFEKQIRCSVEQAG